MYSASPQHQPKETHLTLETTLISHCAQFGQVLEVNSLRRPDPMRFVPQSTLDREDQTPVLLKVSLMSRDSRAPMLLIETVRRLSCEAEVIPVVLDGRSVPLDVGRAKRLATAHQRRALEAIYETCAIDGCDRAFHMCNVHHIEYWENGGKTDLNNMVPLCTQHHHAAHEGGWKLRLDPMTRRLTVT